MAKINDIIINPIETRPCYVNGKKAMFHRWMERREAICESPMIG